MKVVRPLPISLTASSVPETDYPAWAAGTTYALGARVIVAALHRVYESVVAGNTGHDPATAGASYWIDAGPTNRWAMFDPAAGPATSATAPIVVTLALADAADAIGLVDLQAASVRVQLVAAGLTIFDQIRNGPAACEVFLQLPAGAARVATITIMPAGGAAIVGKLITGAAIDLGTLGDGPTVGLTDFSRRETDTFGITTIAERGWTKRIEGKCRVDAAAVDGIQRQLVAIRAQAALWIGEGDYPSLISYGFFKDFSQIVSLQGISTCSLAIDGLPAADIAVPASDPALSGASDFQVVRPVTVTDAVLRSSSVAENDYPVYSPDRTYIDGERVLVPSAHRIFESVTGSNKGNTPGADAAHWVDAGPSKRWAMFDKALGTATTAAGSIAVQLRPGSAINALALLDVVGASVRVQAAGYDRTQVIGAASTMALFLDLAVAAGTDVTVTVTASAGNAAVGTLLMGACEGLGLLEDAPTSTILDFSTKETDEFGQTVPVERAWAKKMEAKSQIATARADALLRRLATLRAVPALWIGSGDFEALTIYGFFRDFTVTLGETVSTTSVTIEGLAKASPDVPSDSIVKWENIVGPGKPADNATVGAPAGTAVGGVPAEQIADAVKDASGVVVPARQQFAAVKAQIDAAVGSAQSDAATARSDAAAARTDLAIETQRAKDAEGAINTTIASVKTTADQAKAGVTDEATARAAGDVALGNRIITTEAQLTGSQGSNLLSRITDEVTARVNAVDAIASRTSDTEAQLAGIKDSALKAKISTEETTRAGGDAALANRATSLEASAGASATGAALNPNFARWVDGADYPASWSPWGMENGGRISRQPDSPIRGSPYSANLRNDTASVFWGIVQTVWMMPGKWVIEAVASLDQGSLSGAGVTISGAVNLDFVGDPDTNGITGLQTGVRAWSKMIDWPYAPGLANLHAMCGWDGFGRPISAKYLRWFYLNVRPATDGEIRAGKALTDAGTALSRITAEETTRATQDSALSDRISSTEAKLAGSQGSQLQARIANEETARATQVAAVANRTSTIEASVGVDAASLNVNPTFKVWGNPVAPPDGWNWWDSSAGIVRASGVNGRPFAAQFNAPAGQNSGISQSLNAAFGAFVIEVSGRASDWQGAGVLVQFCDDSGNVIENAVLSAASTPDTSGYTSRDGGGGAYTRTFPLFYKTNINGGIRRLNLYAMANWDGFGERSAKTIAFDRVSIRPATAAEIAGQRADSNASNAQARVEVTERAIAGLNTRTAAYWQVLAVAGNNRAQMTLHADANGGAGVDIVGDVNITGSDGDGSAQIGGRGVFTFYPNGAPCVRLGRW